MDSSGRQRTASSGSGLSLPSSSTLRRLPTLARSPFRRSDKASSPAPVEPPASDPASTHQRGSTFPSLSQVVVDESSVSSAFFASTSSSGLMPANLQPGSSATATEVTNEPSGSSSGLLPPSRSSSLLPTPEATPYPPLSPFPNRVSSSPMVSTGSDPSHPPLPVSHPYDMSDLEPITYPAHLAQTRPDPFQSPSSSRAIPRREAPAPPVLGPVQSSSSAGGGPPFGVPKRKESILTSDQSPSANGTDSPSMTMDTKAKDGETDSGTEETAHTRRRANTRARPRERSQPVPGSSSGAENGPSASARSRKPNTKLPRSESVGNGEMLQPSLPCARSVQRVPASAMYFSPLPCYGRPPNQALRAHSGTLVGEKIWLIGGVDKSTCWRGVACFDTETLQWTTVETCGDQLPPLRAHTTTLVGDKLYIFGGGDGPSYSNEVWILDTVTHRFSRPTIGHPKMSLPPPRRAHTTVMYKNHLVVFGGGNGQAALNDVWALDVSDPDNLTWHEWKTKGDVPQKKGYHTANLVGDKMVVFGGSDGHASFADIHVLNLQTRVWTLVPTEVKYNRLSHTSTRVGSYLFVMGGHNGQTYAQDVLLFNLVTLQWETKNPKGVAPPGRGYHVALLHDARIFISGGYNGESVFDDLWALDLSAGAYLPQVTTFEVDETATAER
ncbi:hypothetical protein IAU60_000182 [Kwoniella sp. DSM 27419]